MSLMPTWLTSSRPDDSAASEVARACAIDADTQPVGDLRQGHPLRVEPRRLYSRGVRQGRATMRKPCPSSVLVDGAAVDSEPGYQVVQRDAVGVRVQQGKSIRGTQTGLRLARLLRHRATVIGSLGSLRTRPAGS